MAGIRFSKLVADFVANLERSGATVIPASEVQKSRPARLRVVSSDAASDCIVFLWTITHGGGRKRPEYERRIQLTNLPGIPLEPGYRTLLGGWNVESETYAFWDPRRHIRFARKSPSLQVTAETLETAGRTGIATYLRPSAAGREVVVAVHPDSLLWYVQHGLALHNAEDDALDVRDLVEATPEEEREFIDGSEDVITQSRRYDLVELMQAYRDAQFRPRVLRAYRYQCCVCSAALKLVDAAHIVPVADPRSSDEVTNGIALCRLHHGAYDNGLLGVQSDFSVVLNPEKVEQLQVIGLASGLEEFRQRLPARIEIPPVAETRPNADNLVLGLESRNWPAQFII